jgi:hypothetical protein
MGQGIVHFIGTMARESTMDKMNAEEKKFKGFPMFLHLKILKRAFLGDMKQWWSRHWHRRRLYRRRHRCGRSRVKRKRNDAKGKTLVMVSKR